MGILQELGGQYLKAYAKTVKDYGDIINDGITMVQDRPATMIKAVGNATGKIAQTVDTFRVKKVR